ncbi:MAG: dCMP deaminase family protein [Alphaproteobacteria bacterium]|nr:dCMP deaminase family protein [Alphaproteobacteria bacterium]
MDKEEYYMAHAKLAGSMSHCIRHKVGAVLVRDSRVICEGRNGTISGQPDCCEMECPECNGGKIGSTLEASKTSPNIDNTCKECGGEGIITNQYVVHAEQNLITFAAKEGIRTDGTTMYVTLSPCIVCAKLIIQSGITKVVFMDAYRDLSGVNFLRKVGIKVEQHKKNQEKTID